MRIAAVAAAILLAACTRETPDVSQNTPSQSTTMASTESASTETALPGAVVSPQTDEPSSVPTVAPATMEVHLIEYQIHMPATLPAGRLAINVENGGKEDHGLVIEGAGQEEKTDVLKRGDTAALEVNLAPGTYTVYCPVKGHRGKGMETKVVVK
ncbi:MAG TPA: plastocyanin/azurin family copper-binding protein [Thermoanaerobaculia bacterium]|nr:plastocyanin/azurin family copper-binding protein [Thermoanaerobaculia bacterium]